MRPLIVTVCLFSGTLLAGCGGDEGPLELSQPSTVALVVSYDAGGGDPRTAEIHCGERPAVSGYGGRSARPLCRDVERLRPMLTAEPDRDRACAQIYGGPQSARIEGEIEGERVDREFKRTDSCELADWRRIEPLLPVQPST